MKSRMHQKQTSTWKRCRTGTAADAVSQQMLQCVAETPSSGLCPFLILRDWEWGDWWVSAGLKSRTCLPSVRTCVQCLTGKMRAHRDRRRPALDGHPSFRLKFCSGCNIPSLPNPASMPLINVDPKCTPQ